MKNIVSKMIVAAGLLAVVSMMPTANAQIGNPLKRIANSNPVKDLKNVGGKISKYGKDRYISTPRESTSDFGTQDPKSAILSGDFAIESRLNGLALDVPRGAKTNGLQIIQWPPHRKDAQRWRVVLLDRRRSLYKIINDHTNMALDVTVSSASPNPLLTQRVISDSPTQQWRILPTGRNTYKIVSRANGQAIDVPYGSKKAGTKLVLYPDHGQTNQQWRFTR